MANKWIEHVKAFAKKMNMKYNEALKHPDCKASYKSGAGVKEDVKEDVKVGHKKKMKKGKGLIDEMGQQQARVSFKENELGLGANAGAPPSK